ncbi:MAG: hypothetical protein NWF08_02800 [Candidatus Bathyarchaeota archaeon]|nr:hypothetical protein [Candidatus Bathyarchaeota archaeon]
MKHKKNDCHHCEKEGHKGKEVLVKDETEKHHLGYCICCGELAA